MKINSTPRNIGFSANQARAVKVLNNLLGNPRNIQEITQDSFSSQPGKISRVLSKAWAAIEKSGQKAESVISPEAKKGLSDVRELRRGFIGLSVGD